VLFVSVSDASMTDERPYDMERCAYIPDFIMQDKKLRRMEQETRERIREENERKLSKYRIVMTEIDSDEELSEKIAELLERHKYAGNNR
jgi:hypothetical protein